MLEDIDRHALFNDLHRCVEQYATTYVEQLLNGTPDLAYPPNHGFLPDEEAALASIPKSPAMERALRKLLASASATTIHAMLCLVDGVTDAESVDVSDADSASANLMLHDGFYESYWAWRRRRPDPGWKLDTFEG